MKIIKPAFFAVSFEMGFLSPNVPLAQFTQGNKKIVFMLDTGSAGNIISKQALSNIEHTMLHDANYHTVTGIGGTEIMPRCSISFESNDEKYNTVFMVSNNIDNALDVIRDAHGITISGVLGSEFLKENNIILDFTTMSAYTRASQLPVEP